MEATANDIAGTVVKEACDELDDAVRKIGHCLKQLSDDQVWWRPAASMNSIGNLILHVCGNLGQWIVSGVGGTADNRDRPKEFSERRPIAKDELLKRLDQSVAEAKTVLANASTPALLKRLRIQSFDVTGIGAVIHSISHFRGHTQEIIHLTRCQLGEDYEFAFVPKTPEQGAAQQ